MSTLVVGFVDVAIGDFVGAAHEVVHFCALGAVEAASVLCWGWDGGALCDGEGAV